MLWRMKTSNAQLLATLVGTLAVPLALYLGLSMGDTDPDTALGWTVILSMFLLLPAGVVLVFTVSLARWATRGLGLPAPLGYPVLAAICPLLLGCVGFMLLAPGGMDAFTTALVDIDEQDRKTLFEVLTYAALPGFVAGIVMLAERPQPSAPAPA